MIILLMLKFLCCSLIESCLMSCLMFCLMFRLCFALCFAYVLPHSMLMIPLIASITTKLAVPIVMSRKPYFQPPECSRHAWM